MGKTEIVLEYSLAHRRTYNKIVWIRADSEQQIKESFRAVAHCLNISSPSDDTIIQVFSTLSHAEGRVLLVYDSLDDRHLLEWIRRDHSPRWRRPLNVVITTRDRRFLDLERQHSLSVGPLSPEEGRELLEKTFGAPNRSLVELGEELGWHPLALYQAASYLKICSVPPRAYLRMLRDKPIETLRERLSGYTDMNKTAISVFETSMDRVAEVSPYAEQWLTFCSYLGCKVDIDLFEAAFEYCHGNRSDRVSRPGVGTIQKLEWLFQDGDGSKTPLPLRRLSELSVLNLIDGSQSDCWEMHPLVATWARHKQRSDGRHRFIIIAACFTHACAEHLRFSQGVGVSARRDTLSAYYAQLQLARHVAFCVDLCDSMLKQNIGAVVPVECTVSLAALSVHAGDHAAAETMLKAALGRCPPPLLSGEESESATVDARRILAWALRKAGSDRCAEALEYQQAAVEQLKACGDGSGELLRAEGELATIYRDLEDYTEAIRLQEQVVEKAKTVFKDRPSDLLHEMSCLATIYWKKGDAERSLIKDEEALSLCEKAYPSGIERYKKMQHVAFSLYSLHRYQEAMNMEKEVLEGMQRLYGDNHLETAAAKYYLSKTLWQAGDDIAQALGLASDALRVRQQMLGAKHERTQKAALLASQIEEYLPNLTSAIDR